MIKRIAIALVLITILFLAAITILPGLVPTDTYRDKLEASLSQTFARDVKISGDIKLSTFPIIKVETGGVTLSNSPGFSENNFVDVQGMSAKVKLLPLLRKQVEISGVTLNAPTVRLEKSSSGEVNWTLNETSERPVTPEESGPYKRDGRYTEYDPSLALLQISNGKVFYSDAVSDREITIEEVNLSLKAPGLRSPASLNGDLIIEGLTTKLSAELTTPHKFLSGEAASFEAIIDTDEGRIDTTGEFLKSEDIAFNATYSSSSEAPLSLARRLPLPEDLTLPPLSRLNAAGDISYGPNLTRFPKLDFAAKGAGINVSYNGRVEASDALTAEGDFIFRLDDMSVIAPYLESPIEGLDLLSTLSATGRLSYAPESIQFPNLDISAEGRAIEATFNGRMDLSDGATSTGVFSAKLDDVSVIQPLLENPIEALTALSSVSALGDVAWTGKQFSLTNIESTVSGPDLAANFNGDANYNEGVSLSGSFDAETRDLPAVIETAGLLLPDAAALKRLTAKGQLIFADDKVTVSDLTASASEGFLNGQYEGEFGYDEKMNLAGQFNGEISDLGALDAALPRDIPYSDVAKRITLSSQIGTTAQGYALSGLSAALEDGLLNGDFKGQLSLGDKSDVSGLLTMSADSLREIAMTQDVDVPPSTPVGRIFEAFQLSGEVSGTAEVINFNNGALGLDNISTSGDFVLNMTGTKPLLTGQLDMNALDLRPYMAAWSEQKPDGVILPWSTTPINLGGLEAVDAEINFNAPEIIMDRLKLGATEGRVDLKNALLSTDLSKSQLYGGLVNGSLSLSGASGIPRVSIQADIDSVTAQNFLSAASGFDKVAGTATLSLSLDGQGISQDAIMKSLTGKGSFKILNGQLLGINADELMSGLDTALTNRTIPQGLGLGKVTNFKDLIGNFSITNGRANLGNFELQSGAVFIDAAGMVDIGAQRLNIGIRPKLSEGSDLAQFGIPLKFSGAFGEAKAGLDTDVLADIAKAKAREKAGGLIQDRVGGTVGGILGGIIGGNQNVPAQETSEIPPSISSDTPAINESTQPPESPKEQTPLGSIDDATEQSSPENAPVTEGVSPEPAAPDPATSPETESSEPSVPVDLPKPEEAIENALKDLFGRKKKENTGE
jgi:uncharacterized protein involved in outer membrane biogenesis